MGLHNESTFVKTATYGAFVCFEPASEGGGEFLIADGAKILKAGMRTGFGRGRVSHEEVLPNGCGSKLNRRGYAGFGSCFHLPGFHFGTGFLSHSQMAGVLPSHGSIS